MVLCSFSIVMHIDIVPNGFYVEQCSAVWVNFAFDCTGCSWSTSRVLKAVGAPCDARLNDIKVMALRLLWD
jgi:hypothetical protein